MLFALLPALILSQGLPIKSGSSGNLADVDGTGALLVRATGVDGGVLAIGDKRGNLVQFGDDGRIDISQDQLAFRDVFSGATLAAHNKWFQSLTTMTATVGGGALTLNAAAVTTVNTYANLTTVQKFRGGIDGALYFRARARPVNLPQANAEANLGLGNALTNAAPTDGLFFRWTASGGFECVLNRGGAETSANMTPPANGVYSVFTTWATANDFFCEYETPSTGARAEVSVALSNSAPSAFNESPGVLLRLQNGAVAPALAPQLLVGVVIVGTKVQPLNRTPPVLAATSGLSAPTNPLTGAQAANFTNSTAPTSATLSNTAAGYTTLGGKWQFAAVAGAVTDFALFGFQVPTSFRFVVTGVRVSTCNTGAASATTPTMLEWGLGFGATAVSLATADATGAAPTSAPRRVALGEQSIPVGTAVGACIADLDVDGAGTPLGVVESGRFLHVILQVPVGTATASQVIRGTVLVRGYFEQ